jgi:hypothetical protein
LSNPNTAATNRGDHHPPEEEFVLVLDFVGQPIRLIAHRFRGVYDVSSKPPSTIEGE